MRSIEDRFWEKVDKTEKCWIFMGTRDRGFDYGRFRVGRKKERAHRVAWTLTFGAIPEGMWVLHHCDTPSCVRPDHLFLGDCSANQMDAYQKGRLIPPLARARGEDAGASRLTEDQVREIRASCASQRKLGERYGVSQVAISKIKTRKTWAHVK